MQYIFADGTYLRPEIIISSEGLPPVDASIINKFIWRGQHKGWVTSEIMIESVRNVLIPEIKMRREKLGQPAAPCVLHLDGHKSHTTDDLKKLLKENNITLRLFVAHASHIQQPLDLVMFFKYKKLMKSVSKFVIDFFKK